MNWNLFLYNLPESISKHWKLMTDDVEGNALHLPDELAIHSGGLVVSLIITILVACVIWWSIYSKSSFKFINRNIGKITFIILLVGAFVYLFGYWEGGFIGNITALLIHSAVSSFGMFVAQSDLDNISPECKESFVYMTVFALIHIFAILTSVTFVIHLVGYRLISYWRLKHWKRDRLFIFWGINDKSILLAKDIKRTKTEEDKPYHLVFVKTPREEDISDKTEFSFYSLFNRASQDKNVLNDLEDLDALVAYSTNIDTVEEVDKTKSIFLKLGLKGLLKAMLYTKEIHLFFFSENEMENLTTMSILKEAMSSTEKDTFDNKEVHLYCHARKSKRSISYSMPQKGGGQEPRLHVHIVDSSDLAAIRLKQNVLYHPVSYMKADTEKGVVTKPFNALVMGFGETGRSVFKFIYEFASLLDSNGKNNLFHCDIYDPNMDELKNGFYMRMPALKQKPEINFIEGSDSSPLFWENVKNSAQSLDYAVIAINNDKQAISIASNLFEQIVANRSAGTDKFTIFVRVYHSENYRHMKDITDYYNNNPIKGIHGEIVLFGRPEELFTYQNIVDNQIEKKAMIYFYQYTLAQDGKATYYDLNLNQEVNHTIESLWQNRRNNQEKRQKGLEFFYEIQQKETEDFSNVWHIDTKMWLMGILSEKGISHQRLQQLLEYSQKRDRNQDYTKGNCGYPTADDEKDKDLYEKLQNLFMNIAQTEHLRWNASMELMGYTWLEFPNKEGKDRDYPTKKHACLTDFDSIIKIPKLSKTIKYDCTVTDTSLEITKYGWEKLAVQYENK